MRKTRPEADVRAKKQKLREASDELSHTKQRLAQRERQLREREDALRDASHTETYNKVVQTVLDLFR